MTNTNKLNAALWIIGILALIWNLLGVYAYLSQAYITDEALALLQQGDQDYINNSPAWVTAAFAVAVFAGAFGCIALLMRKKLANMLLLLSFIAVLVQSMYNLFIQDYVELSGQNIIMPMMIILVSAFLVWYSRKYNC